MERKINNDHVKIIGGATKGIRGEILTFYDNPFHTNPEKCYLHYSDGLIIIQDGIIIDVGEYNKIHQLYSEISDIEHYTDSLIMPGFIDCHIHYVQSPIIGSYGDTLLEWLEQYTFPMETRYSDKNFADKVAKIFFRQILEQGTTTANVFATTFETSVDAFFEESEKYNTRMICGKVLQDQNLPDPLKDISAEESVTLSEKLLKRWHKKGRQLYAVIPRFVPTSSKEQLQMAGQLYQKYKNEGVYLHTHLNESEEEIAWVKRLFPNSINYTSVYDSFGMIDNNSILAHCCLMKEEEWELMHKSDSSVAHCPSSNLFLGDGIFKYWEATRSDRAVKTGIATDVGGGTNFSILRQLNEVYKTAMLNKKNIDALKCFYMATRGGAEALNLEDKIGSIAPGYEADLAVIDLKASDFIEWRLTFTSSLFEKLFVIISLGLDNMNKATYIAGEKVFDRFRTPKFIYPKT